MYSNLRSILSIGFGLAVWGATIGTAPAQFGGLQIQIGRGPYGGSGLYLGGFNVPFGVGPSIPPGSRAYMGPQYESGYRGYYGYGVGPSLGIYGHSPYDPLPAYSYPNRSSIDELQQYQLLQNQLQLQALQRRLSGQQAYQYDVQSRYSRQSPRVSPSTSDLRPGMVLPDGSTVISVGPIMPSNAASQQPNATQPNATQPNATQPNVQQPNVQQPGVQQPGVSPNNLPPSSPKPSRAVF